MQWFRLVSSSSVPFFASGFNPGSTFHNPPDTFTQLWNEWSVVVFYGFHGVSQPLRNIIDASTCAQQVNSKARP